MTHAAQTAARLASGELQSVSPATLEVVGSVPVTPLEEIAATVERAAAAQALWAAEPFARRRRLLAGVASTLLDNLDELASLLVAETGRPRTEAYTIDLMLAAEQLVWLARESERVLAPERLRLGIPYLAHKRARTVYEPLGVIGVIAPWNLPLAIPLSQAATAIAAGNAVVVKPSELTPLTGAWVARLFAEAGAPDGLVSIVQGAGDVGEALVRAPGVAKVVFTGSGAVGRKVASAAGELLRPVTLTSIGPSGAPRSARSRIAASSASASSGSSYNVRSTSGSWTGLRTARSRCASARTSVRSSPSGSARWSRIWLRRRSSEAPVRAWADADRSGTAGSTSRRFWLTSHVERASPTRRRSAPLQPLRRSTTRKTQYGSRTRRISVSAQASGRVTQNGRSASRRGSTPEWCG